jgi:bacillithiol biosynthesis cysteine-adding enzyme BshC
MNPSCLKHTQIPGTSRLFADYLYHFDRLKGYFDWNPLEPASFQQAAGQIRYPPDRREAMVQALARQNPGVTAIDVLARPDSVAVVTGQQVGLFSGPAYTVYKAITAVRLAQRLTKQGLPAAAIFWLATEDHDLDEVDHAWVFQSKTAAPVKIQARLKATGGPVGATTFEDLPIGQLQRALEGFPYADDVVAMVKKAYAGGATLGAGFTALLKEILRDLGLLFLDPLDPAIRQIAAPFLATAAEKAPELVQRLQERSAQLEAAEYHAQVHVDRDSALVFLLDEGRRLAFKLQEGRFVNKQASYSLQDLQARSAEISPNALLRPVMQDFLLPTVAYVGGPAEIAYLAQSQVLYHELLGRMPVIVPRNSFTLLDHHAAKSMARYHLQVQDLLQHEESVRDRISQQLIPPSLDETFSAVSKTIDAELSRLSAEVAAFDVTLKAALDKSGAKIRYQMNKVARKTKREALRRDGQTSEEAQYLINTIYPHRHLQERLYSILPFLAEHGMDLIGNLLSAAKLDCPDHMVRETTELPALVYSD